MHKVKGTWVVVALSVFMGVASFSSFTTVSADTDVLNTTQTNDVHNQNNVIINKSDDKAQATKSDDKAQATKSDDKAQATKSDDKAQATKSDDKAQATKSDDKAQTTKPGPDDKVKAEPIKEQVISDPHFKIIEGKTYFIGDDGQLKKNFTAIVDGKTFYFGKDTGELQSNDKQYAYGLESVGNPHNAAFGYDGNNFTNTNGFLTADCWYRPVDILHNGDSWIPSTANDYRPLLMTWWPDKDTQVAYLEYMRKNDLLSDNGVDLSKASQKFLTIESLVVQANIEKKITEYGNVDWLKQKINNFVDSQPNWNITSEMKNGDHLQGGALLYVNSQLTPNANSDYRLIKKVKILVTQGTNYY